MVSASNTLSTLDLVGTLAIAWQWLISLALAFWIGILVIESIVFKGDKQPSALLARSRKQAQPLQWICLSVMIVAEVIVLILRTAQSTQSQNGNPFDLVALGQILFQSSYSFLWFAQVILILGSLGLLWWFTNRQKRPVTIALLILAGLISIAYVLSGDVALPPMQLRMYAIILDCISFIALSVWFGALAYLGYVLLPMLPVIEPDRGAATLTILLRRFYPLVLVDICILIVSEFYLTMINLGNVQQFITEAYGRALLVKWLFILIMIIFSAYVLYVLRPKLIRQAASLPPTNAEVPERQVRQSALDRTTRSFRQLLSIQSWLGAAALLCAALATFFVSSIVSPFTNGTYNDQVVTLSNVSTTQTKQVGNLSVMLTVTPGEISVSNTVSVRITDTRSRKLVMNEHVVISANMEGMHMGSGPQTMTGDTSTYVATFANTTFSMTGYWDIALTIQSPRQVQDTVIFTVWLSTT